MSYLNKENVFSVASQVYNEVQSRYNLDVEGHYLDDIQKVMTKLWEKNKSKQLKPNQSQKLFHQALNRKTVELVLPQVFRNIEGGYLNKTQNNIFVEPKYEEAHSNYKNPQMANEFKDDTNARFEREAAMRRNEMMSEGNKSPPLENQKNMYSQENYQDKPMTYDNQLPITPEVKKDIEPDSGAERFVNGEPVYIENSRQNIVKDLGPTNAPDFFAPRPDRYAGENTGPSLDTFFKDAGNLRGELGMDTTIDAENRDVEDKFDRLKVQYMQDGKLDRPKDASNRVVDVIGRKRPDLVEQVQTSVVEQFTVKERENKVVEDNQKRAQDELILTNVQSNNAFLNYPVLAPEKIQYQTRKYFVTVDSLQRDTVNYPLPTNFQVRFEQPDQEVEVPSFLNSDGVVIYKKPVVYQNVGGKGAKLENIYQNIVEIKCLDAQIPLDTLYIGGFAPYDFNGPKIDENKQTPGAFGSDPYGPVWQENYGIRVDSIDEPYYFLVVDEIDGAYDGTTLASRRALAKLNFDKNFGIQRQFVNLKTAALEGKTFYPTNLGKLSQMTLQLVTRFNQLLDVGVDKIFIEAIEQGEEVQPGFFCPIPAGKHLTKIRIVKDDPSYNQVICGVGLKPGDRLIFYSIFNCNPLSFATKLSDGIYINFDNYPRIYFYMIHDVPDRSKREKKIDVRPFLKIGDIIVINNCYILDIESIDNSGIYLKVKSRMTFDPKITVTSKGFVNVKYAGNSELMGNSFLAPNGLRVGGQLTDPYEFQILYPFEEIPSYLKSPPYGFFKSKEAFYLHAKKQISYTFEITQVERDAEQLNSRVIAPGN